MSKRVTRYFIIGSVDSRYYGIDVRGIDGFGSAERDVTTVSIPGRNGSLTIDNGGYKDVSYKYECIMYVKYPEDFEKNFSAFRDAISALQGSNVEIHDSYHPFDYVIGRVDGGLSPDITENAAGAVYAKFDVKITRKPQRYLRNVPGMHDFMLVSAGSTVTLTNPTNQTAYPVINVISGTGQLVFGSCYITVNTNPGNLIINTQDQEITANGSNANGDVSLDTGNFPTLKPGSTTVITPSGMSLFITTHFWRL